MVQSDVVKCAADGTRGGGFVGCSFFLLVTLYLIPSHRKWQIYTHTTGFYFFLGFLLFPMCPNFGSHPVPIKFSTCSPIVPNRISLLSHMVQPKLNFHVYRLQKGMEVGWVGVCVWVGSQYVPQVLNVFPNMFSIAPHFHPKGDKCCCPFTYVGGPKGRNFKIEPSIFGSLHSSFFLSDGPIKLAPCNKKKELGRQLI